MRKLTFLLLILTLTAFIARAGGYQVGLHGQKNIGMGLIGTSLHQDASSIFYNPAGMSFLQSDFSFSGGVSFIMARVTYQAKDMVYQAHLQHEINTPFYFYGAMKATKDLSVGIAVNAPYGNGLKWDDKWAGRYLIQDIYFKAITIQPSVSYKFKDLISIGAGLVYAFGSVDMNKAIPVQDASGDGNLHIKGKTDNWGFNAGILVQPTKKLSLGLDYRSKIDMKVKSADATFDMPSVLASSYPATNKVSTSLPLPANLDFGASYEFSDKFMIGLNLCYVFWGVHDSVTYDFETKTDKLDKITSPSLYKDKLIIRLGAQYKLCELLTIRLGGYYDPSPIPDDYFHPQTPNNNELGLTCGLSIYPVKKLSIDAAFLYLMGFERDGIYTPDNFAGKYKSAFYIPGIGLTYNF